MALRPAPGPGPAATAFSGGVAGLIARHAARSPRCVLLLLLVFSLVSWAIIIYKGVALHRARRQSDDLPRDLPQEHQVLRGELGLRAAQGEPARRRVPGRLPGGEPAGARRRRRPAAPPDGPPCAASSRCRARWRARPRSRSRGSSGALTFLATTASVTPFVGLFGTVWGIMNAFGDIGRMGSANLAVVAPGISEALITTAMGLLRRDPGRGLLQLLHQPHQGARLDGGRLRARVPEHRRA